uniref:Uncharacterized protein n=1 Tax=Anguilla anguilla TaxID=7936 RepID=A0A0E9TPZ4_ANGAN
MLFGHGMLLCTVCMQTDKSALTVTSVTPVSQRK